MTSRHWTDDEVKWLLKVAGKHPRARSVNWAGVQTLHNTRFQDTPRSSNALYLKLCRLRKSPKVLHLIHEDQAPVNTPRSIAPRDAACTSGPQKNPVQANPLRKIAPRDAIRKTEPRKDQEQHESGAVQRARSSCEPPLEPAYHGADHDESASDCEDEDPMRVRLVALWGSQITVEEVYRPIWMDLCEDATSSKTENDRGSSELDSDLIEWVQV